MVASSFALVSVMLGWRDTTSQEKKLELILQALFPGIEQTEELRLKRIIQANWESLGLDRLQVSSTKKTLVSDYNIGYFFQDHGPYNYVSVG